MAGVVSTLCRQPASSTSEADDPLTAKVEGTWHILHYYDLAAPHYLYTPDDGTRLTITPDSIQLYAEQTLIQDFGTTPRERRALALLVALAAALLLVALLR